MGSGDILGFIKNRAFNRVINGALDYWQRGTSGNLSSTYKAMDRFVVSYSGDTGTDYQWSRVEDSPIGKYSCEIVRDCTGDQSSYILQRIESIFMKDLVGKQVTLSFYLKNISNLDKVYIDRIATADVEDDFSAITNSLSSNVDIDISDIGSGEWKRYSYTFTVPNGAERGLMFRLMFENTGDLVVTHRMTGFMLQEGPVATDFVRAGIDVDSELRLCKRYFEKSYDLSTSPGASDSQSGRCVGITDDSGTRISGIRFDVFKRINNPVIKIYNDKSGGVDAVRREAGGINYSINYVEEIGQNGFYSIVINTSSTNDLFSFHYTADAEL